METMLKRLRALNLAQPILVVGMGLSGRATLDLLREAGYEAWGVDEKFSERRIYQRDLNDPAALAEAQTLVISPGIDRRKPAIASSFAAQLNDIEIFARLNDRPVLAVTGSNGKSTVVSLLQEALRSVGKASELCGNIGRSVLETLFQAPAAEVFVLELSSYQLELCPSLNPHVGAILNITPDHLDRYDSFADYAAAKARLAVQSTICVLNGDDEHCLALAEEAQNVIYFGTAPTMANRVAEGALYIKNQKILEVAELQLNGTHNASNVLCALLMLQALGLEPAAVLPALKRFPGLPHRSQTVAEVNGVRYIDDSKATNIGATAAALAGLKAPVYLIAGGVGKGQDFELLAREIQRHRVRKILLIGTDNAAMTAAFRAAGLDFEDCGDMVRAVQRAKALAQPGEVVLLAPATASFDQYSGYDARGNHFAYEAQNSC